MFYVSLFYFQGSLFGVSGRFPNIYAGCVMMGQALGGVLPAVGAILMTSIDVSPKLLGPASFSIILGLLCLAVACHRFLANNKFFLYFAEGKANRITGDTSVSIDVTNVPNQFYKIQWCPVLVYPDLMDCRDLVD